MTTCTWYVPWSKVTPAKDTGPLPIAACFLWDETACKCLRNEDCPEPRPWPVHVVQMKEEER